MGNGAFRSGGTPRRFDRPIPTYINISFANFPALQIYSTTNDK